MCKNCPGGYFQRSSFSSTCSKSPNGSITLSGGAAFVDVPHGSYIFCNNGMCDFASCTPGKYGSIPPSRGQNACKKCLAGFTSFASSISCAPCSKGKFSPIDGSTCLSCPKGFFQPSTQGSKKCFECPLGYKQDVEGESVCIDLKWTKASDCDSNQYLNDSDSKQETWSCVPCVEGGWCSSSNAKWTNLQPLFGWWKIEPEHRINYWEQVFTECQYHPACPGGYNTNLKNLYHDDYGNDVAVRQNITENTSTPCSTALGFKTYSRLCHTCAVNHRRQGNAECERCPESIQNWGLLSLGLLLVLCLLNYMVYSTIAGVEINYASQAVQKIILNYLQVSKLSAVCFSHAETFIQTNLDLMSIFFFQSIILPHR